MESVNARSNELSVEDVTPIDVKWRYYCPRLVDHLELRPLDVLTSSSLEIEMWLAAVGAAKALHVVGPFILSPFTKFGMSQESAKSTEFSNYMF
jgi:hypothetical protein